MLELRPMTQEIFSEYMKKALLHLGEELSRARDISLDAGRALAQISFEDLFPNSRVDDPDQYLFSVRDRGVNIGVLHFGIRRDASEPYVYVWDIWIEQAKRGMGYGRKVMKALELEVSKLGLSRISLNVFGHNSPAISLYETLGYRATSISMSKEI
jgi:ribosomal protein S18 acetylase RimI-like enzyme